MYKRIIEPLLARRFARMPIIVVTGPRQSGKTTLIQDCFPSLPYVLLEDPDTRAFAESDPRAFLKQYEQGALFDEAQKVPTLFSYLQGIVDKTDRPGQFVLSGSQNFLLLEKINQSLAGRVDLLHLLPLSYAELTQAQLPTEPINKLIFQGSYPRVYKFNLNPSEWYPNYIQTYVERDVRDIKNITDLSLFKKFLKLCAGRVGQLLNLSSLANDCGITHNTAQSWISLLEASFVLFLLKPYHEKFGKQLIKSPKLYFYDTGVLCSLLDLDDYNQLDTHYLKGGLFENFILIEIMKQHYNAGHMPTLYFWRDKLGREIDCLIKKGAKLIPIEIKAGQTINGDYFKNIHYWQSLQEHKIPGIVIYCGDITQQRTDVTVLPWQEYFKENQ